MLTQTFFHVPGIGIFGERSLWQQGCWDWRTFLDKKDQYHVGSTPRPLMIQTIEESVEALAGQQGAYFDRSLGPMNAWRAWPEFKESCVYLDIETDGTQQSSAITTIGLYDGTTYRCLIQDQDLDEFPAIIKQYSMIVTFFGTGFDLPMLKKCFPKVVFDQIHLDLCPTLRVLGYKGGLKKVEKQLGIVRGEAVDGMTGYHAVQLWRSYRKGSTKALETLIEYNREDVINLERLTEVAYKEHRARLIQVGCLKSF